MLNCAALLILRQIHGNGIGPTGRRRMVDAAAAAPVAAAAAAAASPAIATAPAPAAGRRWAGSSSSSGGGGGGGGGCSASGVISGTATWLFVSVCFQHYFPMACALQREGSSRWLQKSSSQAPHNKACEVHQPQLPPTAVEAYHCTSVQIYI